MILLLFDAYKLDISDEFKSVIDSLKGQSDKIRVVLNKADLVNGQQLMRVYGALMWSLGKVLKTPEVVRVYIGSFWDQPYQNQENAKLFDAERADLFKDLHSLPRNATIRKVNELVKRARLAKVHAYIISHLRNEMPAVFGKEKKQKELLDGLKDVFYQIHRKFQLPVGDFPDINRFRERLQDYDFSKFAKLNQKMIDTMDEVLGEDIPKLMRLFPQERALASTNPFETSNPFNAEAELISFSDREKYNQIFDSIAIDGRVPGAKVRDILMETKVVTCLLFFLFWTHTCVCVWCEFDV